MHAYKSVNELVIIIDPGPILRTFFLNI